MKAMRVRTEARRTAILKAATDVFVENGYAGASMAAIAARVGGSKATLYGYFPSKAELLVAVLREDAERHTGRWLDLLEAAPDLEAGLAEFGAQYLRVLLAGKTVAMQRILIGQTEAPEVSRAAYEQGVGRAWIQLAGFFSAAMADGRLTRGDAWQAAMHLKGLLGADLFERRLYGAIPEPPAELVEETARGAAAAFVRLYGP